MKESFGVSLKQFDIDNQYNYTFLDSYFNLLWSNELGLFQQSSKCVFDTTFSLCFMTVAHRPFCLTSLKASMRSQACKMTLLSLPWWMSGCVCGYSAEQQLFIMDNILPKDQRNMSSFWIGLSGMFPHWEAQWSANKAVRTSQNGFAHGFSQFLSLLSWVLGRGENREPSQP